MIRNGICHFKIARKTNDKRKNVPFFFFANVMKTNAQTRPAFTLSSNYYNSHEELLNDKHHSKEIPKRINPSIDPPTQRYIRLNKKQRKDTNRLTVEMTK